MNPLVFGPLGRRIVNLAVSPNGRFLAFQHIPQNYYTGDYHWLLYRAEGDTFVEVGTLPGSSEFALLDDGQYVALQGREGMVELARYAPAAQGMTEVARWDVWGTMSLNDATLRLMPSGREALVLVTDQDDKQVDWGGGPPPDYIQTWLLVDLATGETREKTTWVKLSEPTLSRHSYEGSRGLSVLVAMGAPPWVGTRAARECAALQKIIEPLSWKAVESAIRTGPTRLLTSHRVIEIASGQTLAAVKDDSKGVWGEPSPRFHDLSPDENYVLSTVEGGHFALWNVPYQSAWQPELPAHGGVHRAFFLPGGRAVLGTKLGGAIVIDCTPGITPADTPW
ncbi:MAG TPA: hypothetical protein VGQ36_03610 [Thermoanaerobaculia bacterium]|jgi:hypothetical protein|nr:hypothetical protein [Thermoanaerobaculia bacterium]